MTGYRLLSPPSARWHVIGLSAYAPDPAHRLDNNKKEAPMMPIRSNPFTRRALCLTPLALALLAAESVQAATCTEIGRAHVCTPVTNAHLVCRLLLTKKT